VSKDEEEEKEETPDKISHILGHLSRHKQTKIKKIVQKMAFTYKDWHEMLLLPYISIMLQYTFQGQPPLIPLVYNMEVVLPVVVEVLPIGVCRSPSLVELKIHDDLVQLFQKRLKQTSNKKVRPHEIQEKDFVPKKVLSFQPDSMGKWTPNYEGLCAITFTTMDGDKLARPMSVQSRNTLSKRGKRSISRKPEKAA